MPDFKSLTSMLGNRRGAAGARLSLAAILLAGAMSAAGSVEASDLTALSDEERTALQQEFRDYLTDNPELLLEILMDFQRRAAEEERMSDGQLIEMHSDEIFADGRSWAGGNPEGDVTFVEFIDYRCGYCRRAYEDVEELIESDGNIRYVVKEFPILGPESERSARLALAALQIGGDSAYKAAHDLLISYNGPVSDQLVQGFAKDAELEPDELLNRMNSDSVDSVIYANYALADSLGINGTPAFIVDGIIVRQWIELDIMRQVVKEARSVAKR